jgi:hypothetical protein
VEKLDVHVSLRRAAGCCDDSPIVFFPEAAPFSCQAVERLLGKTNRYDRDCQFHRLRRGALQCRQRGYHAGEVTVMEMLVFYIVALLLSAYREEPAEEKADTRNKVSYRAAALRLKPGL